jgi:hypothetical protein
MGLFNCFRPSLASVETREPIGYFDYIKPNKPAEKPTLQKPRPFELTLEGRSLGKTGLPQGLDSALQRRDSGVGRRIASLMNPNSDEFKLPNSSSGASDRTAIKRSDSENSFLSSSSETALEDPEDVAFKGYREDPCVEFFTGLQEAYSRSKEPDKNADKSKLATSPAGTSKSGSSLHKDNHQGVIIEGKKSGTQTTTLEREMYGNKYEDVRHGDVDGPVSRQDTKLPRVPVMARRISDLGLASTLRETTSSASSSNASTPADLREITSTVSDGSL